MREGACYARTIVGTLGGTGAKKNRQPLAESTARRYDFVCNYKTMNIIITELTKKAIAHLKNHLRKNRFFIKVGDGITKFAGSKRGNKVYAYLMDCRINPIVKALTKDGTARFITLTHQYTDPKDSWLYMRRALSKFVRKAKFDAYIYVYEAHAKGGCHVHIIATGGVSHDRIRELWEGHVKIKKVTSPEVGAYLTKEIGKQGHIETALKHAEEGTLTDADVKKIWRFYYLLTLRMRGWGTSRNLPLVEPDDDDLPPDLINDINNSSGDDKPKIYELPSRIIWDPKFRPYCERVDPGSPDWTLITDYLALISTATCNLIPAVD